MVRESEKRMVKCVIACAVPFPEYPCGLLYTWQTRMSCVAQLGLHSEFSVLCCDLRLGSTDGMRKESLRRRLVQEE